MRYRAGFCPANNLYDPITATLLVVGTTMSAMSAATSYKNSKSQSKALVQEGELKARERDIQTRRLAAKQRTSFLNAGISLTGEDDLPGMFVGETIQTGLEDVAAIKDAYNTKSSNVMGAARSKMIGDIAGIGMNLAMAGASSGIFEGISSGNMPGTGLFGSKVGGQTQSEILGFNTKMFG